MSRVALCVITILCLAGCVRQVELSRAGPEPDEPGAAARFRYEQRLSEDGTIPDNALMIAKRQRDKMIADASQHDGRSPGDALIWTWLGPGNIGGRLRAIIVHPTQPQIMWVGSCSGGIWKTTNSGASWSALNDFLPSLAIGCMAIDPVDPNVLYAGTGEGFFETVEGSSNTAAIRGAGIFKSTDGGTNWTQIPSTANPNFYFVNRLAISPASNQIMLAATSTGIYRSIDGGTTWTLAPAPGTGVIYDLQFHPTDGAKAVAARHDATPLYSIDGGMTWLAATGVTGHRVELRYARSNPSIVYAAASNSGAIKIYRSTNGGQTYGLQTAGGGISTYEAYNNVIWVDPTNPNTLLLGGVGLYRSTDGGVNLTSQFGAVHADQHVIVNHPGYNGTTNRIVFFGCDGGIYTTSDALGNSATELNNNLGITQFYGAAVNNATGVVVAGAQDNGTTRYTGGTETWSALFGGDGGYCAADPTNSNYFYGEVQYLNIFRSSNGGSSANYIYSGITDAGGLNCNFIPFYMLDPNNSDRMLAGGRRLWRSNNARTGAPPTWTAIKPTIEPPPSFNGDPPGAHFAENSPYNISAIAVAEGAGGSDVIWVGYNNGQVWKTNNGTAAVPIWAQVDAGATPLPDRWISRIVIDRNDFNRVYVAIMGWADNNVWRTTDSGQTWTDISGAGSSGLPTTPVASLAQDRLHANRLYAGTDIGLFMSNDDGQTWFVASNSAGSSGTTPVDELVWKNDTTLMAVTHGRGVYLVDVTNPAIPGDITGDGHVNVDDLLAVITSWGRCPAPPAPCPADIAPPPSGDGAVNVNDLLFVITHWG